MLTKNTQINRDHFADAKENNSMRWTTLRGLKKLSMPNRDIRNAFCL